jgi:hypothetical protein
LTLFALPAHAQSNTFPSSGSVGVGTVGVTSVEQKLHVIGRVMVQDIANDSDANALLGIKARGTASSPAVPQAGDKLLYIGAGGYNGSSLYNYNKATISFNAAETWSTSDNGTYIAFHAVKNDSTSLKERVRIDDNGDVGIGVTNPYERLQVRGDILAEYISDSSSSYAIRGIKARGSVGAETPPLLNDSLLSITAGGYTGAGVHPDSRAIIGFKAAENWTPTTNGTFITFETTPNGSTSRQRVMTVDQSGMVSIGTNAPTHPLTVNGAIRAKEIIVDTGWADYVFAPDYRLAPLSEVEQHIKQCRRLPDVPSAQEVAEKGVSVGESQALLLRKVEELTLHLIAQEKEMARLRSEVVELKASRVNLGESASGK